ncbi:class I SAM-dependent methyltransferase [Mucilaginibacter sp. FT3.2]|uniref:class I SAM-dependent methyltransferase n=1 Tax=Mucilaginibacter sp. FT3.2 TaxID=2723090 RepID=UPI00161D7B06|nr:class I SAM-dependent methyltransferase [Mucilaginibacter sp. FT3.2]MBB6233328.1 SAM-dependent methyltransferase [Mucilaginibacter sp. FT3.2]
MLSKLFRKLVDISPKLSLRLWKLFYEFTARPFKKLTNWKFMNYGFAYPDGELVEDHDTLCANLYRHLFAKAALKDKDVLEVGCGRGGGCHLVLQYQPKTVTGLDYSENGIKFCKQTYKQDNLNFVAGNAESLPFEDNSFDIIVNLESSHCYGNRENFFKEVARALKPGGYFLYADFMGRVHYPKRPAQLTNCQLKVITEQDITANVLLSMDLNAPYREAMIKKLAPKIIRKPLGDFVGLPGSDIYNRFNSGETIYFSMLCEKV